MKILFEYADEQERIAVLEAIAAAAHIDIGVAEEHLKAYLQNYIGKQYKIGGIVNARGREKKFAKSAIKETVETLFK